MRTEETQPDVSTGASELDLPAGSDDPADHLSWPFRANSSPLRVPIPAHHDGHPRHHPLRRPQTHLPPRRRARAARAGAWSPALIALTPSPPPPQTCTPVVSPPNTERASIGTDPPMHQSTLAHACRSAHPPSPPPCTATSPPPSRRRCRSSLATTTPRRRRGGSVRRCVHAHHTHLGRCCRVGPYPVLLTLTLRLNRAAHLPSSTSSLPSHIPM